MSDVTMIGLGSMGSVLARTLLSAGRQVTVWNRSREKAENLVDDGAQIADSIADAINASPVILICVNGYAASAELFTGEAIESLLADRCIVQLSSGTPKDASESEAWFMQRNAGYLDAAILGDPQKIGTPEALIILAGDENRWKQVESLLRPLAENLQHVGVKVDSAAILDLAWLCQRFGLFMGVFQGLLLCQKGGVALDRFGSTVANDSRITKIANTIHNNSFDDPVNNIQIWVDAMQHIKDQARETGANTDFLEFIARKFELALEAGYGEQDLAALFKVLDSPSD